ncbi:hypothetical protein KC355_g21556, partial [Hortaea werneckii]
MLSSRLRAGAMRPAWCSRAQWNSVRAFSQSASRCRATPLDPSDEGLNKVSSTITQPIAQGASQAQLYATGLNEADLKKAQVGISSVWFSGNPCNMHLLDLNHA